MYVEQINLIHMNGRGYDPKLGRFLSVDPFIQSPTNTQSVNPYTYIFNNPLSGTDPTGYASQGAEEVKVKVGIGTMAKRTVTVKGTQTGSKGSVTITGGSSSERKAIASGVVNNINNSASQGGNTAVASKPSGSGKTWNKSKASGIADKYSDTSSGIGAEMANMDIHSSDLGQTASRELAGNRSMAYEIDGQEGVDAYNQGADTSLEIAAYLAPIPMLGPLRAGYQSYKASKAMRLGFSQTKVVLTSAQQAYKGSTVIGHALSKHAGKNPGIWGKVTGSMTTWNAKGMKHLRDIYRGKGKFRSVTTKGRTFIEKRLNDGRGIRLNRDYSFKGFID